MVKNSRKNERKTTLLIINGLIVIVLGLGLLIFNGNIMSYITEKVVRLSPGSFLFKYWQKFLFDVPTTFRFFNWTNSESFFNKSVKPRFEEIGPYQFLLSLERVGIVWNDNDTITFKQMRTFRYDEEFTSNGNLSDELITLNYMSMSYGHRTRFWHIATKDIFEEYLGLVDPYYYFKTTVDAEMLTGSINMIPEIANYFDFVEPQIPRYDRFGWLRMRNGDPNFDGVFNIGNGANRNFDVLNWNYHNTTPYFNSSCGAVRGSVGDIHSVTGNKEFIYVFVSDLCRYVKLYFEEEITLDGILGYKYSITERSLDNGTLEPENYCFCDGDCFPSGLFNLSSCRHGFSGFGSLPHFYNADPVYVNVIEGLNPEKSKHQTYVVLEPTTMVLMDLKLRVQLNMFIHPIEDVSFFDNFPELYFPLFWIDQETELPEDFKFYLKIFLKIPIVIFSVGAALLVFGLYLMLKVFVMLKKKNVYKQNKIWSKPEKASLNEHDSLL